MKKIIKLLVLINSLLAPLPLIAAEATSFDKEFDHFDTGFPLEREHAEIPCQECHYQGIFSSTPRLCSSCHSQTGFINAFSKPPTHINSSNNCDDCHIEDSWEIVTRIDHGATFGNCASCHNGTVAEGKHPGHLPVSNNCEECHTSSDWSIIIYDHADVAPASCSQCHNGQKATGMPATHIKTGSECDSCHNTSAWSPATFDHDNSAGRCNTCHDGQTASGKSSNHFVTQQQCDNCHSTSNWQSIHFRHSTAAYPGDHRADLGCLGCHRNNNESISWRYAAYRPDCAACHAGDYEQDEHKKTESPRRYYSVSELRDCSGSCHVYKDGSMTTITERRDSLHRVNDSEFDD